MIYLGSALLLILIFVFDHLYLRECIKNKKLENELAAKNKEVGALLKRNTDLNIENINLKEKVELLTDKNKQPYSNPYDFAEGVLKGDINFE
jgi:regulator of replication initiation timing